MNHKTANIVDLFSLPSLPINEVLQQLGDALSATGNEQASNAVLVAPPGAGKTTRVPLFLAGQDWAGGKKIIVLEPRRIAARSAAAHMAQLLGEPVGKTIGLKVRFETLSSAQTRVEVVTEGVFARMILDDPELDGVAAIVFDEFHERSVDADFGLALALDAQAGLRPDLRLLPMSATLDGAQISRLMDNAQVVESEGRSFPVDLRYRPRNANSRIEDDMASAIEEALRIDEGSILVFLPGMGEINRTATLLERSLPPHCHLHKLYGVLSPREQDLAIKPARSGQRKIVLATAIAETSLTIDGVTVVIDSGLSRIPRFDPESGITRLETVKASRASVEQRAGRAGRTAPGIAIRLWHESNNLGLVPANRPQILDADMRPLVLDLLAWGAENPEQLRFSDQPPQGAWKAAVAQLIDLGAVMRSQETGRLSLSPLGKQIRQLPVAPHLSVMIIKAKAIGAENAAARLAITLSEAGIGGRENDLELQLEQLQRSRSPRAEQALKLAGHLAQTVRKLPDYANGGKKPANAGKPSAGAILFLGMPERLAMRTQTARNTAKSPNAMVEFRMANGKRASIDANDPLAKSAMLVIAGVQGTASRARIVTAAVISEEEFFHLAGDSVESSRVVSYHAETRQLRARLSKRFMRLELSSSPAPLEDGDRLEEALINAIEEQGLDLLKLSPSTRQLLDRLQFAHEHLEGDDWPAFDMATLASEAHQWLLPFIPGISSLNDITQQQIEHALLSRLPQDLMIEVDRLLPGHFTVPTGSRIAVHYRDGNAVVSVRVQELYGLDQHPHIGRKGMPITFELLSPAQRPIQTTRDIGGFWRGSWADVRRDMKGRYPKHVWPEEPQHAEPTRRAKPKGK